MCICLYFVRLKLNLKFDFFLLIYLEVVLLLIHVSLQPLQTLSHESQ